MKIIGIAGKKRSGKDTMALSLKKSLEKDYYVVIIRFADAVKDEVSKATRISVSHMEENKELFRPILQWWGTDFRKTFQRYESYWIDKVKEKMKKQSIVKETLYIIPDVRFRSEYDFIERNGGYLIKMLRQNQTTVDNHISENDLDNIERWNYIYYNNFTIEDLRESAKEILPNMKQFLRETAPSQTYLH